MFLIMGIFLDVMYKWLQPQHTVDDCSCVCVCVDGGWSGMQFKGVEALNQRPLSEEKLTGNQTFNPSFPQVSTPDSCGRTQQHDG